MNKTETQAVRMARMEEKIDTVQRDVQEIKDCTKEFTLALSSKADKEEVKLLNTRMWAIATGTVAFLLAVLGVFVKFVLDKLPSVCLG